MQKRLTPENTTERLARLLYTLVMVIAVIFNLLVFMLCAVFKNQSWRARKWQRFGVNRQVKRSSGLLIHCVSVGEVSAATPLIKRILQQNPDSPITITTTTATGAEQVKNTFKDTVQHIYLPYDLPVFISSLINKIKPEKVMITEVELWPNFIHGCWQRGIPVYLINARLTDKSAKNYSKIKILFSPIVKKLEAICAQGQRDYDNYRAIGAAEDKVLLSNNMKFDLQLSAQDVSTGQQFAEQLQLNNRTVLLGASTHEPEEQYLLDCYQQLKTQFPALLLILTPRHPQRFAKVEKLITQQNLSYQRLSDKQSVTQQTDVLLADQMGILKCLYQLATIAFVGGSLAHRGGHNALEAALVAKPILMGPSQHNNPAICDALIQAGALVTVKDAEDLGNRVREWLEQPNIAETAGTSGFQVIKENAGAIDTTLRVTGFTEHA